MHSTDEALRMRGQLPAIPSTATVHQTIQTVSRELRLILEIPRPAERQFVSFEIGGHRQGRAGNLFYNRSDRPWFHELPALTVATSMHAGELYQYNPYVTIYLLAETHVFRQFSTSFREVSLSYEFGRTEIQSTVPMDGPKNSE